MRTMDKSVVPKKIFVVDDDVFIGNILKIILESERYRVSPFTTGRSALQLCSKKIPDLLILDYFLMGENFSEVIHGFKSKRGENFPIILMSANKVPIDIVKEYKIREFVEKPFQRDTIVAAVIRNLN